MNTDISKVSNFIRVLRWHGRDLCLENTFLNIQRQISITVLICMFVIFWLLILS